MTISDETSTLDSPINNFSSHLDIADLVRSLDERARSADERARAADDRSAALAERVALLESQITSKSDESRSSIYSPFEPEPPVEKRPSLYNPYESERNIASFRTGKNVRIDLGSGSIQDLAYSPTEDDAIQTVVGVVENTNTNYRPQDPATSALQYRLDRIEDRLYDVEEETRASFNPNEYTLPESTFSLLVTEHPLSSPFIFALFTVVLSLTCLGLVLADSVQSGTADNPINIPPGVSSAVRAAQFVGILVGVLFEDECPQGLQHLAFGAGHTLLLNETKKIHKRLVAVSVLRLTVGYMFLSCLFINVVQNSDVIGIFYDVLALEFVENIDDTAFALAKKGFLGQKLLIATVKRHTIEIPMGEDRKSVVMSRDIFGDQKSVHRDILTSGSMISNSRSNNIARMLYYLNGIVLLSALTYLSSMQSRGRYRCLRIDVVFSEHIWEKAKIVGSEDTRLLVYPYFNGIYQADGTVDGHPRYIEQDKLTGSPFVRRQGAVIRFCEEIQSWVFMHPDIKTSNECEWLFRSKEVDPDTDYDLIQTADDPWTAWVGEAAFDAEVKVKCTTCLESSHCSYKGDCVAGRCVCNLARVGHYCEFDRPCPMLATEKAEKIGSTGSPGEQWYHQNPIIQIGWQIYNRPIYYQTNLTSDPFDWRKFDVREREPTSMPSIAPSGDTLSPTPFSTPTVGTNRTLSPTSLIARTPTPAPAFGTANPSAAGKITTPGVFESPPPDDVSYYDDVMYDMYYYPPTDSPTIPFYKANEYETDVPDFAEHDDFFEAKPLHDLDEIMQNYSVVMSFTGSRFYATIVEPDATIGQLFPQDYHAFWNNAFNVNRTFVISDETDGGTPVGIDFFEMRRRVPSDLNENVNFQYGPYGALIPNMNYEGAGFFHCLNNTQVDLDD